MRVLLLTWGCDLEDISEAEISARWVREIAKDHEVTLLCVSLPERHGCATNQFPGVEVVEWRDIHVPEHLKRFRSIVKPAYLPYYFKARRFLTKLLRDRQFDVVHHISPFAWRYPSPATGLGVPVVRGPVAGGLRTPHVLASAVQKSAHRFMVLRKSDSVRLQLDPMLRSTYRRIDHVLLAAPYMKSFLAPLRLERFSIEIEHGLTELPKREARTVHDSRVTRFLFVGRIISTKGLHLALRALANAKLRCQSTLTVIGDGEALAACKEEASRLGLNKNVYFLGWCSKEVVDENYRRADVFLFPSVREPTGGVLLEAMSHGLPIITCAYGGPDYMVSDTCGIKVPPQSEPMFVEELAAAIDRLAGSQALRNQMSEMARARAETEFGWDEKRRRLSEIYLAVAQHSGKTPEKGKSQGNGRS